MEDMSMSHDFLFHVKREEQLHETVTNKQSKVQEGKKENKVQGTVKYQRVRLSRNIEAQRSEVIRHRSRRGVR